MPMPVAPAVVAQRLCELLQSFPAAAAGGVQWRALARAYEDFVLELHKGMRLTQLTAGREHSEVHVQLLLDAQTLQVDQGSGCLVEFPLEAVSRVYRVVCNDDRWYGAGSLLGPAPLPPLPLSSAEHIVVVEFDRRRLPFVFQDMAESQRFFVCADLLCRRVKELAGGAAWLSGPAPRERRHG
mmetsp:Transcript_65268/g.202297  ORF Transcript_65268/g.202297 Transcript_65268/m.202297 type:complete len:183 (+) Transcript_65268:102-650(+)